MNAVVAFREPEPGGRFFARGGDFEGRRPHVVIPCSPGQCLDSEEEEEGFPPGRQRIASRGWAM